MPQNNSDHALVLYIAERSAGQDGLGKKAVQKLVHLVTTLGGVPSGYQFSLYTYGPYSRDLSDDIELLESMGALDVKYQASQNRYEIRAGQESKRVVSLSSEYLTEQSSDIDRILDVFSGRTARSLELSSTLLFVLQKEGTVGTTDDEIFNKFHVIKPNFSKPEAMIALAEIKNLIQN